MRQKKKTVFYSFNTNIISSNGISISHNFVFCLKTHGAAGIQTIDRAFGGQSGQPTKERPPLKIPSWDNFVNKII